VVLAVVVIIIISALRLRLLQRKLVSRKLFPYFTVFTSTENNGQTENDFHLTKKPYIFLENGFPLFIS
jgi:hypothetical protein